MKKLRIIGLFLLLAGTLACGVWLLRSPETEVDETDESVLESAEIVGMGVEQNTLKTGENYNETVVDITNSWDEGFSYFSGRALYRKEEKFYDVQTQEVVFELPSVIAEYFLLDLGTYGFDPEGQLYFLYYDIEKGLFAYKYDVHTGKELEKVLLEDWEGRVIKKDQHAFANIPKLMVDEYFIYLLSYMDGSSKQLYIYTLDGQPYMNMAANDFDIGADGAVYTALANAQLCKWDLDEKKMVNIVSAEHSGDRDATALGYEAKADLLYVKMKNHIYTVSGRDLSDKQTVLVNAENMFKFDGVFIQGMFVDGQGSIYIRYNGKIFCYDVVETQKKGNYTLIITAPYREEYMAQMIALYEKNNPEQHILYSYTYNDRRSFMDNCAADQYYERENLQLLSGDVGDIFMQTDQYPFLYERLSSEVLVDLQTFLNDSAIGAELDQMMIEGVSIDGKTRVLPIAMDIPYLEVNTALAEKLGLNIEWETASWKEIFELCEILEGTEYALFSGTFKEYILTYMLASNIPDLIDLDSRTVELEQAWFRELLGTLQTVWDSPNLFVKTKKAPGITVDEKALIGLSGRTIDTYEKDKLSSFVKYNLTEGQAVQLIPFFVGEKNENRVANSCHMYGISAWSENKELAGDFLCFVVQQENMVLNTMKDRVLNLAARRQKLDAANQTADGGTWGEVYIEQAEKLYTSMDYLYDTGGLQEILYDMLLDYLSGSIYLNEALAAAEETIWLSLNE